jgi:hypothetical protein
VKIVEWTCSLVFADDAVIEDVTGPLGNVVRCSLPPDVSMLSYGWGYSMMMGGVDVAGVPRDVRGDGRGCGDGE